MADGGPGGFADGERMLAEIRRLCAFGPRPSGSPAAEAQREYLRSRFLEHGGRLTEQSFLAEHPFEEAPVPMVNVVASWNPDARRRLLVAAHGDTRPRPDRERDPRRRRLPFVGANDGASALAVLLELAPRIECLGERLGVDLVVFDGEELVFGDIGEYCLGSRAFAARLEAERAERPSQAREYEAAIVLDMVGRRGLSIPREAYSARHAPELVGEVWRVARREGATVFRNRVGRPIVDDHLPLLEAGVPTALVIDIDDPRWHTADDVPEHCSAESLRQVAGVVLVWLRDRLSAE